MLDITASLQREQTQLNHQPHANSACCTPRTRNNTAAHGKQPILASHSPRCRDNSWPGVCMCTSTLAHCALHVARAGSRRTEVTLWHTRAYLHACVRACVVASVAGETHTGVLACRGTCARKLVARHCAHACEQQKHRAHSPTLCLAQPLLQNVLFTCPEPRIQRKARRARRASGVGGACACVLQGFFPRQPYNLKYYAVCASAHPRALGRLKGQRVKT